MAALNQSAMKRIFVSYSTENRKLSDIFGRGARYIVPRYQREYVWGKTNWREFYNDISFTLKNEGDIKWSHFLGTIVLNRVSSSSSLPGIEDYEIIDGQQRLTTVFILTCTIYRRLLEINAEESINRSNYVLDRFLTSVDANNKRSNKISNPDHESDIAMLLQCCRDVEKLGDSNVFAPAFSYFQGQLKDKSLEDIDGFLNKMMNATVVEIISTDDEEIYNIFEVLNARGCQLKQIELLKNHVLKYLQPRTGDFIDRAKDDWNMVMEAVSPYCDPDDFINHFSKAYLNRTAANAGEVYRLIKEEVPIADLRLFLDDLKEFAICYSEMLASESSEITYFKIKHNKQIRPLLTSIVLQRRKGLIDEEVEKKAMTSLRNFFFLFNALDLTSNRTDKPVTLAAYGIYHARSKTEFRIVLTELLAKLAVNIDAQAFEGHLFTNNSLHYSSKAQALKKNSKLVRYVLAAYANAYQVDLSVNPDALTIEHLVPDDGMSQTTALANLTLTSGPVNQRRLGVRPILEKLQILGEASNLNINKNLEKFVKADGSFDVDARNAEMARDLVEKVFPFDPYGFGVNEAQLREYRDREKLFAGDDELLKLLCETGVDLETRLENDPSLGDALGRYKKLIE